MSNRFPLVSVIIPTRNEEKYIAKCLDSIINNNYPKEKLEIIIVDGKSDDRTAQIIKEYQDFNIKLFINHKKTTPAAMNIGIKESTGRIIIRLDAHAEYNFDYIQICVELLNEYNADNVGGCIETKPSSKTQISNSIAIALSHQFGVGNSSFRISKEEKEVDTVPFGAFPREVFERIGLYNEYLDRNQDIELNARIKSNGGKIILSSKIKCSYYARPDLISLWRQNFANGKWNIYTAKIASYALSIRHFIPFVFFLSLITCVISFLIAPNFGYLLTLLVLIPYSLLSFSFSFMVARKEKHFFYILSLPITFLTLHVSYGLGSLIGLITLPIFNKRLSTKPKEV